MKNVIENLFGFLYTLSMGDYLFFLSTFIIILAFIYVLFLMLREDTPKNEDKDLLESIKDSLENNYNPQYSNISEYEKEQEKSAIISYDELIKNKNNSYYSEEDISNDEIIVKKINLNERINDVKEEHIDVKVIDYKEYESFLSALRELQKNLLN